MKFRQILAISLVSLFVGCTDSARLSQLHSEGTRLFQQNKRDLARKKLQELYSIQPNYLDTGMMLGKLHYFDLEFTLAENYFNEAYKRESSNLNALLWIIKSEYMNGKKPEDILMKTKTYLEHENTNPEVLFIRGRLLEKVGKIDEAILSYTKATQNLHSVALSYIHLGLIFKKAELFERYEKSIKKAKAISEDDLILSTEIKNILKQK